MNNAPETFTREYQLSAYFRIKLTIQGGPIIQCEWDPRMPSASKLKKLAPKYYRARDNFMTDWATMNSANVAMVDTDRQDDQDPVTMIKAQKKH